MLWEHMLQGHRQLRRLAVDSPRMTPVHLRIREQRERKGWTQLELANAAQVPQSTISRLERRPVSRLDVDILERIASALDVPLSRLMRVD